MLLIKLIYFFLVCKHKIFIVCLKLLKISFVNNYIIEDSSYGLFRFDLQGFQNSDRIAWGNLLRRSLLKDLV